MPFVLRTDRHDVFAKSIRRYVCSSSTIAGWSILQPLPRLDLLVADSGRILPLVISDVTC